MKSLKWLAGTGQEVQLMFMSSEKGEECALYDFDHGMVVGTRWVGLSRNCTVDLLGFSFCKVRKKYLTRRRHQVT